MYTIASEPQKVSICCCPSTIRHSHQVRDIDLHCYESGEELAIVFAVSSQKCRFYCCNAQAMLSDGLLSLLNQCAVCTTVVTLNRPCCVPFAAAPNVRLTPSAMPVEHHLKEKRFPFVAYRPDFVVPPGS